MDLISLNMTKSDRMHTTQASQSHQPFKKWVRYLCMDGENTYLLQIPLSQVSIDLK